MLLFWLSNDETFGLRRTTRLERWGMQDYFERPETVEARAIMRLVSMGTTTIEDARELIAIPQREGSSLEAFVAISGKAGVPIARAIEFRRRVASEFERLVAGGDASEQAFQWGTWEPAALSLAEAPKTVKTIFPAGVLVSICSE
jgi:hypothetical protein